MIVKLCRREGSFTALVLFLQILRFAAIGVTSANGGSDIVETRKYFEKYATITPDIKEWIRSIATHAQDSTCR